jgi:hypothetical protein
MWPRSRREDGRPRAATASSPDAAEILGLIRLNRCRPCSIVTRPALDLAQNPALFLPLWILDPESRAWADAQLPVIRV